MTQTEIKSRVGSDGVLKVDIPVGLAEANRDVVVTIKPLPTCHPSTETAQDWKDFVAETYGSCVGLGLEEPDDLPLQQRNAHRSE